MEQWDLGFFILVNWQGDLQKWWWSPVFSWQPWAWTPSYSLFVSVDGATWV